MLYAPLAIVEVLGAAVILLFGLRQSSEAIQRLSGDGLQLLVRNLSRGRFSAAGAGLALAVVVQSSSTATAILVGLVNLGMVSVVNGAGVVLGAAVGTTATSWLVATLGLSVAPRALGLGAAACACWLLLSHDTKRRLVGEFSVGLGLFFLGVHLLRVTVASLGSFAIQLDRLLGPIEELVVAVAVGGLLSAALRSQAAAVAVLLVAASAGIVGTASALAFVLAAGLGTAVVAFSSASRQNTAARHIAGIQLLAAFISLLWSVLLFLPLLDLIDFLIPGPIENPDSLPVHIAAAHTLIALTNGLLLIGFVRHLSRFVERWIPLGADTAAGAVRLPAIDTRFPDIADTNLGIARKYIGRMAEVVNDMMLHFLNSIGDTSAEVEGASDTIARNYQLTGQMGTEIDRFLAGCRTVILNDRQGSVVNSLLIVVSELKTIAETVEDLVPLVRHRRRRRLKLHKRAWDEIQAYTAEVLDFMKYNAASLSGTLDQHDFDLAVKMEASINQRLVELRRHARDKMAKGADLDGELVYLEIIRHLEHVGDFNLTISRSLKQIQEP